MSTIKQSKNTGNIFIKEIEINSSKIILHLSNQEKILLSSSNFVNYYLYKNKQLEENEYLKLKQESKDFEILNYLYKLINYKPYSKKQLKDKLKTKYEISDIKFEEIITKLIENNQYDPSIFLNEYVTKLIQKGYSKSKIIKELETHNYLEEEILQVLNLKENEYNLENLINELIRKNSSKNIFSIKQSITRKLIELGYSNQDINNYLQQYFYLNDEVNKLNDLEANKLKNELIKTYNYYKDRNLDEYALKNKCIIKLVSKGYKIDDIKKEYKEIINAN